MNKTKVFLGVLMGALALAASAFAGAGFDQKVGELRDAFRHGVNMKTKADQPVKMLFAYLYRMHDAETVKSMKLVRNATKIAVDERVFGTLTAAAAAREVASAYISNQMDAGVDLDPDTANALARTVKELARRGAVFGFDGLQQNEGPTPYLLMLDPRTRTVYGFDLHPSEP